MDLNLERFLILCERGEFFLETKGEFYKDGYLVYFNDKDSITNTYKFLSPNNVQFIDNIIRITNNGNKLFTYYSWDCYEINLDKKYVTIYYVEDGLLKLYT